MAHDTIQSLRDQIKELESKITSIQEECSHPKLCLIENNRASTGNWDQVDYYWTEFHCTLCDKKWIRDDGSKWVGYSGV